jgi:hypothetical protein
VPPISTSIEFEDLALLAEVVFHYSTHNLNERMEEPDDNDVFLSAAARLIEAVRQFPEHHQAAPDLWQERRGSGWLRRFFRRP